MKYLTSFKNWWLGGDPKCNCHKIFKTIGGSPIPWFRERKELQDIVHANYGNKCKNLSDMSV